MALLAAYSKINTTKRSLPGYILFFISTLGFLMLDVITSGRGGIEIYIGVCVFVACFGVADAHVQAGMLGDLASINPDFIQSFLAGVAASGALTSALRLTTKAAFDKSNNGLRKGALLFLAISTFCEVLCIFLYAFVFSKLSIVKYYRTRAAQEGLKAVAAADMIQTNPSEIVDTDIKFPEGLNYKALLIENYDYALGIYLLYLLTLSIYPGFLFENTGNHQLGSWYPLVLIAIYNVCDLLARHIPLLRCLKLESRKGLMIAVLSRFLFIPAFLFTAKYGDQAWMIMLIILLGLTNGYLMVCLMTLAPKGYKLTLNQKPKLSCDIYFLSPFHPKPLFVFPSNR
ncbi:hypothetical protein QVD17_21365 [Tagetes erecta]|uniref:Equilibrative nucleoside transporter n=1 Tax=Tagetes erecta TaxID=13708 RepID=A0AAD8KC03_TARER|nr:hypothetical protein QVD17_21365 [Tagetes erecta]